MSEAQHKDPLEDFAYFYENSNGEIQSESYVKVAELMAVIFAAIAAIYAAG